MYNNLEIPYLITGKNALVGPIAEILGPVIVEDKTLIRANSVVLKDVPKMVY